MAGSLLAYFLLQKGGKIIVIDEDCQVGEASEAGRPASSIAAGVINPITGKRYVKSWRIDEMLPKARDTYQAIEKLLNVQIWQERSLIRTLQNIQDENQWLLRSAYDDYVAYCSDKCPPSVLHDLKDNFHDFLGFAEVKQAAQVHVPILVSEFRKYLKRQGLFFEHTFNYEECLPNETGVVYKHFEAKKIIFCEGAKAKQNPYFDRLPFNLDKGELLIVKIPDLKLDFLFKHHLTIVPLKDELYWVGATNDWQFDNDQPTEVNKQLIINELQQVVKHPFEVMDHQAAIRPTVKDRRPFIGFHPDYSNVAIFNGFGTKGASLIPYWAEQFSAVLLRGGIVNKDVNIDRYMKNRETVEK